MAVSGLHTGFGYRKAGGRQNNSDISIYYAGTEAIRIDNTDINFVDTIAPLTSDGAALGTASLPWSDLHLASEGVIDWNGGDVTLTHRTNVLTVGGGDLFVDNGYGILVGHDSQVTANTQAELQVLGSARADGSAILGVFSADALGPELMFLKSRGAQPLTNTIVQDNDMVGRILAMPADGVDFATVAAAYEMEVDDASPAAGDIGMAHVWRSMPGGGGALTERMRLSAAGDLSLAGALTLTRSADSAAVADQVSIGRYEIGAGNTVLAISQETAVAADTDETKFSNKLQVRINGATYYIMLTTT